MVSGPVGALMVVAAVHAAPVAASVHGDEEHDRRDPQPVGSEELDHDSPLRWSRTRTAAVSTNVAARSATT